MTEQHSSFGTYTACDLWQHLFRDNRGHLQIFAGTRNGGRLINTREAYFNYPQDIEYAVEWASEKSEEGQEVYYCAHLLTRPERNKANAAEISALYADLDTAPLPNGRLKPTAVVRTSTGNLQGYWRLTDSLPPVVAESINRRLTQATGADPSGYDLTQLLRVPATVNHKYEESPVVEVLEISDTAYTPGELD